MTQTWTVQRFWTCDCEDYSYEEMFEESELDSRECPTCGGGPFRMHTNRWVRDQ